MSVVHERYNSRERLRGEEEEEKKKKRKKEKKKKRGTKRNVASSFPDERTVWHYLFEGRVRGAYYPCISRGTAHTVSSTGLGHSRPCAVCVCVPGGTSAVILGPTYTTVHPPHE